MNRNSMNRAFSLVELVIVLVIIGVIAAIAVPRLTRGATNASATALDANLAAMRNAIELFRAEHEGAFPTTANIVNQLTQFSDVTGTNFSATADVANNIVFGPYLKSIPTLPVGAERGSVNIAAAAAAGVGWIYTQAGGTIKSNTTDAEVDKNGKKYNLY